MTTYQGWYLDRSSGPNRFYLNKEHTGYLLHCSDVHGKYAPDKWVIYLGYRRIVEGRTFNECVLRFKQLNFSRKENRIMGNSSNVQSVQDTKYWVVIGGAPKNWDNLYKHWSERNAEEEAARLARNNPGVTFTVFAKTMSVTNRSLDVVRF